MSKLLVSQYQRELEELKRYSGSRNESSIRAAFQRLLGEYCKTRDFRLIPELEYRDSRIRPDGTVKDALRLDWGYWESKDEYDDLDAEIEEKFAKGYPKDNIIFEDSQTAILIQGGEEQQRVSMEDAEALDKLLLAFTDYVRPEVKGFREALEQFKTDVPEIAAELRSRIAEASRNNGEFQIKRDAFLSLCRESINPEVSLEDVTEMMVQHILSEDIFTNIFNESYFHRENNIARSLSQVIATFFNFSLRRDTLKSIEHYYAVIKRESVNIANHHEKQKFLKVVYENFYKAYNPKAADRLGIVYTPNEIVRFMLESTDYLLHRHFGKILADEQVEILDPATGTGTFITELIEYLPASRLEYKYLNEIHCNEVAILPYYIANLNIEYTYQQKMGQYQEFQNICLVDTLDHTSYHYKQMDLFAMTMENTQRINRQNDREISVIIGNPPYNAWQESFNQNNANRAYGSIDNRIRGTYVKQGKAQNQNALYDMYVRFVRWASDRISKNGVIAFVSNSSFIDGFAFDGFRKVIAQEFNEIWMIDTKGNARNSGERRRKEGGNVFNDEIKVGIAVYFLVRSEKLEGFKVYYNALADYAKSEEKQAYFVANKLQDLPFDHIRPDKKHNWINLTDNDFDELLPLIDKEVKAGRSDEAVFQLFSRGVGTYRDEWVYDFSQESLTAKMEFFVETYQATLKDPDYLDKNKIKWDRELRKYLGRKIEKKFNESCNTKSLYRPFTKKYLYFDKHFNGMTYQIPSLFPSSQFKNLVIAVTNHTQIPFLVQATNTIPSLDVGGRATQCLPLYRYDKEGNRQDNITDWALALFRQRYLPSPPTPLPRERGEGSSVFAEEESADPTLPNSPHPSTPNPNQSQSQSQSQSPSPVGEGFRVRASSNQKPSPVDEELRVRASSNQSPSPVDEELRVRASSNQSPSPVDEELRVRASSNQSPSPVDEELRVRASLTAAEFSEVAGARRAIPRVLLQKAKELRQTETHAEKLLWQCLRNRQLNNAKFRRQHNIGQFIVDFYCHDAKLVIELDGEIHQQQQERDRDREIWLQSHNIRVLRFPNKAITDNLIDSLELIATALDIPSPPTPLPQERGEESGNATSSTSQPHPSPSPVDEELRVRASNPSPSPVEAELRVRASNQSPSPVEAELRVRASNQSPSPVGEGFRVRASIQKIDIFHYTYAVLHNPQYRQKYEQNLKRDFPRLPFYDDFWQWSNWGQQLMELHLNYETIEPYPLQRIDIPLKPGKLNKPKLKADKTKNTITLDNITTLQNIPAIVWDYKLGNRSALEWILDQHKEKKPRDATIREKFNTYKFADYKEKVIDLLMRVCTVSVQTMQIINQMNPDD